MSRGPSNVAHADNSKARTTTTKGVNFLVNLVLLLSRRQAIQVSQIMHGMLARFATHLGGRLQASTYRWPFRLAENHALIQHIQLDAPRSGWLTVRHARNRRRDRGRNTTSATLCATGEFTHHASFIDAA
jgi:hypothetical protein